jgi:hypothetical protein
MIRWLLRVVTARSPRPDEAATVPAVRSPDLHAAASRELLAVNTHFDGFISEFDAARRRSRSRVRKVSPPATRAG